MLDLTIKIALIMIIISLFHFLSVERKKCNELKLKVEQVSDDNKNLKIYVIRLLNRTKASNKPAALCDKDIIEAVKYAVIKSHPDNGGKAEDFQRFNNLYSQLKGENK